MLAKLCFDFMVDILVIELRFGQQVAAEPLKNLLKLSFRSTSRDGGVGRPSFSMTEFEFQLVGRAENGYMKDESIDARTQV